MKARRLLRVISLISPDARAWTRREKRRMGFPSARFFGARLTGVPAAYLANGLVTSFLKLSVSLAMAPLGPVSLTKMFESPAGTIAASNV